MPANLTTSKNYGYELLSLFGVSAALASKAKSLGVAVESVPGTVFIKYGGTTHASVGIKGQAITLAKQGTLGPSSKDAFKAQLEKGLEKAINAAGASVSEVEKPKKEPTTLGDLLKSKLAADQNAKSAPTTSGPVTSPVIYTPDEGHALPTTKLLLASTPYEPVFGSTAGSVYRVFAVSPQVKLAARLKGSQLAIRAEGHGLKETMHVLKKFKFDDNGHYASAHFELGSTNTDMVSKTIAALMSLFGLSFFQKIADPVMFPHYATK